MTAQIGDILQYKGEYYRITSEPLYDHLKKRTDDIWFDEVTTACYRGYIGTWEIEDNKLYLTDLGGKQKIGKFEDEKYIEEFQKVGLNDLFPGQERVFAEWYSGELRIPQGEILKYIHYGYGSVYERDLLLKFENGLLIKESKRNNRMLFWKKLFGIR